MDRFPATPEALGLTVAPASAADAVRRAAATLSCGAGGERHPARKMAPRARQVFEAVKARYANAGANMVEVIETARAYLDAGIKTAGYRRDLRKASHRPDRCDRDLRDRAGVRALTGE